MPATVPTAIVHGSGLQLSVGPVADLTACFFNGDLTFESTRQAVQYQGFDNVTAGDVRSNPKFKLTVPIVFKQDTGLFSQLQPGAGVNRANVPILTSARSRGIAAGSTDAGYFVAEDMSDVVSMGKHATGTFKAELLFFPTSAAISGAA